MPVVGGLDIHRQQLTFDYVDTDSGEIATGRISPADRECLRAWLGRFAGRPDVAFALEGCTGWRYVVEELLRAGVEAHVAEPAETAARRGPKRRAKTDRTDSRLLRELLTQGRIPESWIPPQPVLEARAVVRLYKDLLNERTGWLQRVQASLFHMGVPELNVTTMSVAGRQRMAEAELSPATRTAVDVGMAQVDRLTEELTPIRDQIAVTSRRQPACRALQAAHYGIGPLTSVAIWSEMGDCRRFHSSDDAVRHAGLDVTVYSSDRRRTPGTPGPPRPGGPAQGAVPGGRLRRAAQLTRPRLLPAGQGAPGRPTRVAVRGLQARPPLPPHPAQPRRRRARPGRLTHRARAGVSRPTNR